MSFGFFGGLLPLPSCSFSFREFNLLQEYLGRPDQDPEWVRFVQATLLSSPPAELAANVQSFLRTEIAAETQAMIIELYKTIFYGRESPELFIPSRDLDLLVRVAFEQMHIDFNCETLSQIHQSLFIYHHQSPFYSTVLESRAFEILWTRYQKQLMVAHRRDLQAAEFYLLQERVEELMVQREWILSRLRHNW